MLQQVWIEISPQGKYLLGRRVLAASQAYLSRMNVVNMSTDLLAELRTSIGETVGIAIAQGPDMVVVAIDRPMKVLAASMNPGDRAPLAFTAAGKAMLAFSASETVQDALRLAKGVKSATDYRIDAAGFRQELERIRQGGIAVSREEWLAGVIAAAHPIFDFSGVAGAVVVIAPRMGHERRWLTDIGKPLSDAARQMSSRLGGHTGRQQGP